MPLSTSLATLESSGLIRLAQSEPELEYLFRHALIQEATYESMLKADRRVIHGRVAQVLEKLFEGRQMEIAPVLAAHYEKNGQAETALHYFTLAGEAMGNVYANAEAAHHYAQALALAIKLNQGLPIVQSLHMRRGRALELAGQYEAALENYLQLEHWAKDLGDASVCLQALLARITIHSTPTARYDRDIALRLSEQALDLTRHLNAPSIEARLWWSMALLNLYSGRDYQPQAVVYGQQAVTIARAAGLDEQLAYALSDLGRAYLFLNQAPAALTCLLEAQTLWEKLGNAPMRADVTTQLAVGHMELGDYAASRASFNLALDLSRSAHNLWGQALAQMYASVLCFESGDILSAMHRVEEAIRLSPQAGFIGPLVGGRAILAMLYSFLGVPATGIELCQLALEDAERMPPWKPWVKAVLIRLYLQQDNLPAANAVAGDAFPDLSVIAHHSTGTVDAAMLILAYGELALHLGELNYVQALLDNAIAKWQSNHLSLYLADMWHLKGQALLAGGQAQSARTAFREALAQAERPGANRSLWRILLSLARLEDQAGSSEAERLRRRAGEVIAAIAQHCPPEFRENFLHQPDVQEASGQ